MEAPKTATTIVLLSLTRLMLALAVSIVLVQCQPGTENSGRVVKVKDGDSLVLLEAGNRETEIRLAHVDAPERGQPYNRVAREFLESLVAGNTVTYRVYEPEDRYGRVVAEVFVNDTLLVNKEMVRNGYAWHFRRYSDDRSYGRLEKQARQAGLGLWQEPDPVAPWEYRAEKRR